MRFLRLVLVVASLLVALSGARGAGPGDELDTLAALLKELRELRQTRYALAEQWQEEKQELERRLSLAQEQTRQVEKDTAAAQAERQQQQDALAAATAQNQALATGGVALREGLRQSAQRRLASSGPLAREAGLDQGLGAVAAAGERDPGDLLNVYLNCLLDEALAGMRAAVKRTVLTLPDGKLEVEVLRLGLALEFYLTADNRRCGYRTAGADATWQPLDVAHAPALRQAIQVVRKEIPAELVVIPVPATVVTAPPPTEGKAR